MSYKDVHESFVSGHEGTSVLTILLAGTAAMSPCLLVELLGVWFPSGKETPLFSFSVDFALLIIPFVLILTVFSERYILFLLLVMAGTAVLFSFFLNTSGIKKASQHVKYLAIPMGVKRAFITNYRAYVNITTAVCILAVDFTIFPRHFAKAETYGTGLMDIGVGSFMIANAIVSPEARGKSSNLSFSSILKSIKSSLPLLLLGVARVVATKGVDYHEHVTEYGAHWNFFFTLAIVKIFSTALFTVVPAVVWPVLGPVSILIYQFLLTSAGMSTYIIQGVDGQGGRVGLIDSNREGLASSLGYLAIYFIGVQLGRLLMTKRETVQDWLVAMIQLTTVSAISWVLLYLSDSYIEPVSRRFANLSYCLWMIGFNSYLMAALLMVDVLVTCVSHLRNMARKTSETKLETVAMETGNRLLAAVNYNGLFFFLFSNVLTGLVNLSMQTVYVHQLKALLIITSYMLAVSLVNAVLFHRKIPLKFW